MKANKQSPYAEADNAFVECSCLEIHAHRLKHGQLVVLSQHVIR